MSPGRVREVLKSLPKGEIETYDKTLKLISSQDPERVELARKVLVWLVYATRTLSLKELQQALATIEDAVNLEEDALVSQEEIISACIGLATYEGKSKTVQLVHYTTQEYFLHKGQILSIVDGHAELAIVYINHLYKNNEILADPSHQLINRLWPDLLNQYPFFDYAARMWAQHARHGFSKVLKRSLESFLKQQRPHVHRALQCSPAMMKYKSQSYITHHKSHILQIGIERWTKEDNCTPILVAAACRLTSVLEAQLTGDSAFQGSKTSSGNGALRLAALFGHTNVVRMLLCQSPRLNCGNFDNSVRIPTARSSSSFKHMSSATQLFRKLGSSGVKNNDNRCCSHHCFGNWSHRSCTNTIERRCKP